MIAGTDTDHTAGQVGKKVRRRGALAGAVAMCVLLGGASSAWAGVGFSMVPTVPQDVTVGDVGVPSTLVITNHSANGPGESGYATDSYRLTKITLVPSCASTNASEDCLLGAYDPGVLVPNPQTARGQAGTACADRTFTLTTAAPGDPAMGKYSFVPDSPVILGPSNGALSVRQCIIEFTVDVRKAPKDSDGDPTNGLQTEQKASTGAIDIGPANVNKTGGAVGTSGTTIALRTPMIATIASAPIKLGSGQLSDNATVSDLVSPVTTGALQGTVIFRLYGPDDGLCATPIFESAAKTLNYTSATAGTATSGTFTPMKAGTYRWRAFYSGDANNAAVSGACGDANESTDVSKATPAITTDASDDIALGAGPLSDTASVTGLVNPIKGNGEATIEFRLYGANDVDCVTAVFTSSNRPLTFGNPDSTATATSASFNPPTVGRYRWRAFYSGDTNNAATNGPCNAQNESTDVRLASPAITTQASPEFVLGAGSLSDAASVTGLVQPVAAGGGAGTVEFRLYGPDDASCTTAIFTSTGRALALNDTKTAGTASSASLTPTVAGSYRWRAFYSGDVNNAAVSGACTDVNEQTTVKPPPLVPPVVPPPPPPPPPAAAVAAASVVCTPPPGPAPAGGELCARGTSTIRGRTGCQGTPFRVSVSGREIEQVVFTMDGKIVRVLTAPNSGSRYVLPVNPRTKRAGVHRVLARIIYTKQSATRSRTLRVTFSRCGRRAVLPAFTG